MATAVFRNILTLSKGKVLLCREKVQAHPWPLGVTFKGKNLLPEGAKLLFKSPLSNFQVI